MGWPRWLLVAGLAWIGIALGHLATCALADHGNDPLMHSAHSWVPLGAVVAIAAVPGVLVIAVHQAMRPGLSPSVIGTGKMLAAIQLPLFAALEVVERLAAPGPLVVESGVVLGLLIQVVIVVIGALVLAAVVHAVRTLAGNGPSERGAAPAPSSAPVVHRRPAHLVLLVSSRRRAPPLPLAA